MARPVLKNLIVIGGVLVVAVLVGGAASPELRTVARQMFSGVAASPLDIANLYWREWKFAGDSHHCPICNRRFGYFDRGPHTQNNLECPRCGSRERHRTALHFFRNRTDLFTGPPRRMLHIAPESFFVPMFKAIPRLDYLSGDLEPGRAMVVMDITDIKYPDNSFDIIYCSHVLEHVPDDRKAMREMARVLKPGGFAILAVPLRPHATATFEDPSVTTPEDRYRFFGQSDHVRYYAPRDWEQRLRESGFDVTIDRFASSFPDALVEEQGLSREDMYVLRKAS